MPSSNEDFSDTSSDDGFEEDMEAIKRACRSTAKSPIDDKLQPSSTPGPVVGGLASEGSSSEAESDRDGYGKDDLQLVRSIQERFAVPMDVEDKPTMKPLCTLPPDWSDNDDCEDDYETLRAIQRRFAAYNDDTGGLKANMEDILCGPVQVGATITGSGKGTSNGLVERTNAREGFLNFVDASEPTVQKSEACDDASGRRTSDLVEWNGPGADDLAVLPLKSSHFPKAAQIFVDAIKKNRSCQKLLRSKMMQMEARIEELKRLMERVKILKDFQVACKRRTGRALSQKKDPRVQLISVPKLRANKKFNENKISVICKGPPENSHFANYKEALATFAVSVNQEKWSKEERENLVKGVRQQYQGMLLQQSVDVLSETDGSCDSSSLDSIIVSIKDLDITPEKIRSFLPKVNWEQLAAMYVPTRSGAECQARFLNFEDPLINQNSWTAMEDKNLLHIVQQKGLSNWIDMSASLGTNRTPFQCLARYQRSLNASILKREWTKEEDNQLRAAVETFGESNWQLVASVMEGRTGTQCSNRWLKTLHPARKRVGKWTAEEDKRLKVAVTLFGPKTWKKVAGCVPGRTQVQCRERWVNCLDPSLNMAEWTEEEDSKLEAAIAEHGYCWSKVAACIPRRTDNQCWRRWKTLFPNEVPRLQAARKIQKAALISNFVDRESERPSLGPNDFLLPETYCITESENVDHSRRKKRKSRRREAHELIEVDAPSSEICPEGVPPLTDDMQGREQRTCGQGRGGNSHLAKKNFGPSHGYMLPCADTLLIDVSNDEEIQKSHVNDGNRKKKPLLRKKRSGSNAESVDGAHTHGAICKGKMVFEPQSKEYEDSERTEECSLPTLVHSDLQRVTVGGGDGATQSKRASKLHPRRRHNKKLEEMPNTLCEGDMQIREMIILKTEKEKKENKQIAATEDQLSFFPDSMSLINFREAETTVQGSKAGKTKRNTQAISSVSVCSPLADGGPVADLTPARIQTETTIHGDGIVELSGDKSSSCQVEFGPTHDFTNNTENTVLGALEDCSLSSDRDNELQHMENAMAPPGAEDDNVTLASFLLQSGADRTQSSLVELGGLARKVRKNSLVQSSSGTADVSVSNQPKRTRNGNCSSQLVEVEAATRSKGEACLNQEGLEVGAEDDTTLGQLFRKLKKRKTEIPKIM